MITLFHHRTAGARRHHGALALLAALTLNVVPGATSHAASPIIYVNAAATGATTGTSWATAYPQLATALQAAPSGSEIWVARGTYTPTTSSDRTRSFVLPPGVAVYGGFAGSETHRTQRTANPATNHTVLSGNIGNPTTSADNSFRVVSSNDSDSSTVLDGFTITAGNGNGGYGDDRGGGIDITRGNPTLRNLRLVGNTANHGGGMFTAWGSPTLTNVTFQHNTASTGGAIFNSDSHPTLTHVTLSGNTAILDGGAIVNLSSSPTLTHVTISGNTATDDGGAIYNFGSSPTLTQVTLTTNTATDDGGAIYNLRSSSPTLTQVTLTTNTATEYGGAIFNEDQSSPTLTHVTISGNTAAVGGGMYTRDSSPTLTNVIISGNTATSIAGAMYNYKSSPLLTNVTVSGNHARGTGGICNNASHPQVRNSILWGNEHVALYNTSDSTSTVAHSLVEGGLPAGTTDGGHNLTSDPRFLTPLDPASAPTTAGDLRLHMASPAINAGNNALLPRSVTTDLGGAARIIGPAVDLGAHEGRAGVPTGTYRLAAVHSGKAVDVLDASAADGARVVQWHYGGGANQQWQLEAQPDGSYQVRARHSGKVLEVDGHSTDDGTPITQWTWHGGANQRWWIEPVGADTYRLVNVHSGKALDVLDARLADGAAVVQWRYGGGTNQQWRLTLVP